MPRQKEEIMIKVNRSEHNLLHFIRDNGYIKFELECINGEPVKILQPLKAIRLDLQDIKEIE